MSIFQSCKKFPIQGSQLKSCFYCHSPLPASSKEHIFNSSWGGVYKTGQLICDDCNLSFSARVDKAFLIYTQPIMNAGMFKGQRHKSIPTIELEGDYFLDAGAKLRFKKPLIEQKTQADGSITNNISFNSKGEAKRWVKGDGAESWLGRSLSPEDQELLLTKIKQAEFQKEEPQPQQASTKINLREQYRSAAHTILKCLGFFLPDWVNQDKTKQIRQFARDDEGDWRSFAVDAQQHVSLADSAEGLLGSGIYCNSVEIYFCSYLKMVIGVLTILNRIKRAVVISKDYSGIDKILYVFEDINGSGKPPHGILTEINPQAFSLPTIGIQHFTFPDRIYQYFSNEISMLARFYYPMDASMTRLMKAIDSLKKKNEEIDEKILEQYHQAFLEFFRNISKILGNPIDTDKVTAIMSHYGLTTSTNKFLGEKCSNVDFQSLIEKALKKLTNEFVQDSLS